MFYVGVNYSVTLKGSAPVAVRCENCGQKYYYLLVCTAVGRGQAPYGLGAETAKRNARRAAQRRLDRMLDTEIAAVPCPHCGWYQRAMLPLLRKPRLKGMRTLGVVGLVVGGVIGFIGGAIILGELDRSPITSLLVPCVIALVGLAFLLAGATLLLVRRHRNAHYDPNDPETEQDRLALGREYCITREQAEAFLEQQRG
jgi:hypothetical protein